MKQKREKKTIQSESPEREIILQLETKEWFCFKRETQR